MKKGWKIVALVLLTLLCVLLVWNVVEHVKTISIYKDLLENIKERSEGIKPSGTNKSNIEICVKAITFSIVRILYSFLGVSAAIYFETKIISRMLLNNTTLSAKVAITAEALSVKIQETEAKREELLRQKKEKKIAKLQEKLNKYKESE